MDINGNLRLIVLLLLNSRELTGLDLIKNIQLETIVWKPSFGSIYPLLHNLKAEGLVMIRTEGRKKYYSLSYSGKSLLKNILAEKEKIVDNLVSGLMVYKTVSGESKKVEQIVAMLKDIGGDSK